MLFLPLIMLSCWNDDDFYILQYADDTITSTTATNTKDYNDLPPDRIYDVPIPTPETGSSDKCVPRFVNSINPEFEELHIPETVCLTLHCFYLIVYTLQRSC